MQRCDRPTEAAARCGSVTGVLPRGCTRSAPTRHAGREFVPHGAPARQGVGSPQGTCRTCALRRTGRCVCCYRAFSRWRLSIASAKRTPRDSLRYCSLELAFVVVNDLRGPILESATTMMCLQTIIWALGEILFGTKRRHMRNQRMQEGCVIAL